MWYNRDMNHSGGTSSGQKTITYFRKKQEDAHEKHFQEKELKLRKEMNKVQEISDGLVSANAQLLDANVKLRRELDGIKEKYEELLKLSNLSDEDIKKSLKGKETISTLAGID